MSSVELTKEINGRQLSSGLVMTFWQKSLTSCPLSKQQQREDLRKPVRWCKKKNNKEEKWVIKAFNGLKQELTKVVIELNAHVSMLAM